MYAGISHFPERYLLHSRISLLDGGVVIIIRSLNPVSSHRYQVEQLQQVAVIVLKLKLKLFFFSDINRFKITNGKYIQYFCELKTEKGFHLKRKMRRYSAIGDFNFRRQYLCH